MKKLFVLTGRLRSKWSLASMGLLAGCLFDKLDTPAALILLLPALSLSYVGAKGLTEELIKANPTFDVIFKSHFSNRQKMFVMGIAFVLTWMALKTIAGYDSLLGNL